MLDVEDLSVTYLGVRPPLTALTDVSFRVAGGEITGLLGPNGSGKTTMMKAIATLVEPSAGRILVDGLDVVRSSRAARQRVSVLFEGDRNLYWRLSPVQNLEYFAALQGFRRKDVRPMIAEMLERLDLLSKANTDTRRLSRGMKQKLALACVIVRGAPLLLLDEPTLGLDIDTSLELRQWLRELADAGHTIVVSSHDTAVVEDLCPRVLVLQQGRLIKDGQVAALRAVFRTRAYTFTLRGELGEEALTDIVARFPSAAVDDTGTDVSGTPDAGRMCLRVLLPASEDFYALVALLHSHRADIDGVTQDEPNLEQAFVQLLATQAESRASPL
jgi:ABC-2 type transport system ATP-binding protein